MELLNAETEGNEDRWIFVFRVFQLEIRSLTYLINPSIRFDVANRSYA